MGNLQYFTRDGEYFSLSENRAGYSPDLSYKGHKYRSSYFFRHCCLSISTCYSPCFKQGRNQSLLEPNPQYHVITNDGNHPNETRKQGQFDYTKFYTSKHGTIENISCIKF